MELADIKPPDTNYHAERHCGCKPPCLMQVVRSAKYRGNMQYISPIGSEGHEVSVALSCQPEASRETFRFWGPKEKVKVILFKHAEERWRRA